MDTQDSDLIVVGIGTSAGGLESLKEFFSAMPIDSGLAFVVIQHLDPNHVSYMADLLAKCTKMTVVQAEDGMPVVTDTGFGIEPENLPKIFHPFFTAKKKTGLGLGLSICERIVKNHGGKIDLESQPDKGTTFKIYLPLKHETARHAEAV
jgi:K+-sensing histidine kinase KdpD